MDYQKKDECLKLLFNKLKYAQGPCHADECSVRHRHLLYELTEAFLGLNGFYDSEEVRKYTSPPELFR